MFYLKHVHHYILEAHNLSSFRELERNFSSGQSYFYLDDTFKVDTLAAEPQEKPKSVVGSGFFHTYQITRTCSLETTMPLLYLYFLKVKSNENKWPQISFSPFTSKASVVIKFPGILRCTF